MSSRHLSFLETGRARPSREMLHRLAEAAGAPLRERNRAFLAAGFAPPYPHLPPDDPALRPLRHALRVLLRRHEPYPAFAHDMDWRIHRGNRVFHTILREYRGDASLPENLLDLLLAPQGLRACMAAWEEFALGFLGLVRGETMQRGGLPAWAALRRRLLGYPGVDGLLDSPAPPGREPLAPLRLRGSGGELAWFLATTRFDLAHEITASELRVALLFPADESTESYAQELEGRLGRWRW